MAAASILPRSRSRPAVPLRLWKILDGLPQSLQPEPETGTTASFCARSRTFLLKFAGFIVW